MSVVMVVVVSIELIDRLMLFVRIMNVMLVVSMMLIDVCCVMIDRFCNVKKLLVRKLKLMYRISSIGSMLVVWISDCMWV